MNPFATAAGPRITRLPRVGTAAAILVTACGLLGSCAMPAAGSGRAGASGRAGTRVIEVVAAEDVWGSIAAQIGGEHVHVVSIITNPNVDPHGYEPTAADARSVAESQVVVENGIGYDPWAPKLVKADGGTVTVLDVGNLLGIADGGNPHRWYKPADVLVVINRLVTEYQKLDPTDSAYFAGLRTAYETTGLEQYHALIASISSAYRGTPVGASESIFSMLAPALGLDLITPSAFLKDISQGTDVSAADKETIDAQIEQHRIKIYVYNSQNVTPDLQITPSAFLKDISQGTDVSAADKETIDAQIEQHRIKIYVYNSQNVTPDIQVQLREVKAAHIPYATITETLQPAGASYQAWQTEQLLGIRAALARAAA